MTKTFFVADSVSGTKLRWTSIAATYTLCQFFFESFLRVSVSRGEAK